MPRLSDMNDEIQRSFDFVDMTAILNNSKNRSRRVNKHEKESRAAFVITKNNVERIKRHLYEFSDCSFPVYVLDTSVDSLTKDYVRREFSSTNICYHGRIEQLEFLEKLDSDFTRSFLLPTSNFSWDIGLKRNYALVFSRFSGFSRILLIDDDIEFGGLAALDQTLDSLSQYDIVGVHTTGMPDTRSVGHILYSLGIRSYDFISGQYVAISVDAVNYYFPNVYNEDWIFFLLSSQECAIAQSGVVKQDLYDPFSSVERALSEEFGEILFDGLARAVLRRGDIRIAFDPDFWRDTLRRRTRSINLLSELILPINTQSLHDILECLVRYHRYLRPEFFIDYFSSYLSRLAHWRQVMSRSLSDMECSINKLCSTNVAGLSIESCKD